MGKSGRAWRDSANQRRSPTAIAHANDLVLVTLNVKDFARFHGLQVTNWFRP